METEKQQTNEYQNMTTKQLLEEKRENDKKLEGVKPKYNASKFINGSLAVIATAGLCGFVVCKNPIWKMAAITAGSASSIASLVFMYSKFYLNSHNEYAILKKKQTKIQEELEERLNPELEDEEIGKE